MHPLKQSLIQPPYDACLLLLGANDLLNHFAAGEPPPKHAVDGVIDHLKTLHAAVKASGAYSVALGMLDHPAFAKVPGGPAALRDINARIERETGADLFIDTAALISSRNQPALWSTDEVHLQSEGYATLGRLLARPLATLLGGQHGHKAKPKGHEHGHG